MPFQKTRKRALKRFRKEKQKEDESVTPDKRAILAQNACSFSRILAWLFAFMHIHVW
jgi:hypothetical protein